MKKLLLLLTLLACCRALSAQGALNMSLLARWDDDSLPIASPNNLRLQYSGCWAMALNGREYAILGGARHVLVFDITDPGAPALIGKFAGNQTTVWREFKSYQGRFYAVSDATSEGMMILDMRQAPDTIIQSYFSNALFNSSHTITLDTTSGRIYLNGTNAMNQGLLILDVKTNPDTPALLSAVNLAAIGAGGYVHDSYVQRDTVYASCGFLGLFAVDCTDPLNCKPLGQTEAGGYNHNSWASADGRYLYYTEEIPDGRPIQIVAIDDLAEGLVGRGSFLDNLLEPGAAVPKAIPHNVYIQGNLLFNSQYEDGLLVYDIADPLNPVLVAYYDTHPQNTVYNGYYGNWGNYPWLPSGTIVAGDMQNGLYLLRLDPEVGTGAPAPGPDVSVFPNPARGTVHVRIAPESLPARMEVFDTRGVSVYAADVFSAQMDLDTGRWAPGVYRVVVYGKGGVGIRTVVVLR